MLERVGAVIQEKPKAHHPPALLVNCRKTWSKASALLAIPNLEGGRVIQGITVMHLIF